VKQQLIYESGCDHIVVDLAATQDNNCFCKSGWDRPVVRLAAT